MRSRACGHLQGEKELAALMRGLQARRKQSDAVSVTSPQKPGQGHSGEPRLATFNDVAAGIPFQPASSRVLIGTSGRDGKGSNDEHRNPFDMAGQRIARLSRGYRGTRSCDGVPTDIFEGPPTD